LLAAADQTVMGQLQRLWNHLRRLAESENGMALPTAIFATVAAFGLGSAAVIASVDTQRGTARDQNSKEAIAAADAGANVALLRLNRYSNALTTSTPCLGVNSGGTLVLTSADAAAPGWCPPVAGTVGTASYSYRVTAGSAAAGTMTVVATGITSKVSRRVAVAFKGTTVGSALSTDGLIGQESVTISGKAEAHVNIGTNGAVKTGGANATACGDIRHGVGVPQPPVNQCSGHTITEGNVALPPVSSFIPSDITTNNSNYRLATCTKLTPTKTPSGCQSDTFSGSWSNSPWNPSTRTIALSGKEPTLTLGGSDYFICRLVIEGGHLIMASESHVRIFFDTPEHCGLADNTEQVRVAGNGSIEATAFDEKVGNFDMPGLYLLGSPTLRTRANLEGNGGANELLLYAPNTAVTIAGNGSSYKGSYVGKTIELAGNGFVSQPSGYKPPPFGGATLYSRQAYVECTGATASPPNAGC
jgi:hypothetical protein